MTTSLPMEAALLLSAYVDGELDAASSLAFEQRMAATPELARAYDAVMTLRTRLRQEIAPERAPDSLMRALGTIGTPKAEVNPSLVPTLNPGLKLISRASAWRMPLAACGVGLIVGSGVTTLVDRPRAQAPALSEVVADHLRAVMAPQPFDVASSDQHTVKPWFTGRLSFAPQVFDLAPAGFTLIGGRVDVLNGQPAAALVFRHGRHVVSLLSQPISATEGLSDRDTGNRGFQVRDWTIGGMRYWAVSDVAPAELDAFEAAVKAALAQEGARDLSR